MMSRKMMMTATVVIALVVVVLFGTIRAINISFLVFGCVLAYKVVTGVVVRAPLDDRSGGDGYARMYGGSGAQFGTIEGKSYRDLRPAEDVQEQHKKRGTHLSLPFNLRLGTGHPPWRTTTGEGGDVIWSISKMETFLGRSHEELRLADYLQNRRTSSDILPEPAAAACATAQGSDDQSSEPSPVSHDRDVQEKNAPTLGAAVAAATSHPRSERLAGCPAGHLTTPLYVDGAKPTRAVVPTAAERYFLQNGSDRHVLDGGKGWKDGWRA
eukprot:g16698.t1